MLGGYLARPAPQHTVADFLKRVSRFIESCGIYTKSPYLMIGYGASDVAQAYSRIASVFGTIFLLSPSITVTSVTVSDKIRLQTNLNDQPLECGKLLVGAEFQVLEAEPRVRGRGVVSIIVGKAATRRDKYPVLVHLPPAAVNKHPALLFDVG